MQKFCQEKYPLRVNPSQLQQIQQMPVKVEPQQMQINQQITFNVFQANHQNPDELKRDKKIRKRDIKTNTQKTKKRDDNYTFKRAHTLLKKACRAVGCKQLITDDLHDFSKDFFVLLLCKLQHYKAINSVYLQFQQIAGKQLAKIFQLIQNKQEQYREHLKNVVSTILRGMRAFEEYMTGTKQQAMKIIYKENLNFKRTMQLKRAMEKLNKLEQSLLLKVEIKLEE